MPTCFEPLSASLEMPPKEKSRPRHVSDFDTSTEAGCSCSSDTIVASPSSSTPSHCEYHMPVQRSDSFSIGNLSTSVLDTQLVSQQLSAPLLSEGLFDSQEQLHDEAPQFRSNYCQANVVLEDVAMRRPSFGCGFFSFPCQMSHCQEVVSI